MLKKLSLNGFNYNDLDRISSTDYKRKEDALSFYQTFDFLSLLNKWPEIIGPQLAKVTSPLRIKHGALVIITIHPTYSHELSYMSDAIKNAIFKEFPQLRSIIQQISFQAMPQFFAQKNIIQQNEEFKIQQNTLHPRSPQYQLLHAKASKMFEHIEDNELKEQLISIYIQSAK